MCVWADDCAATYMITVHDYIRIWWDQNAVLGHETYYGILESYRALRLAPNPLDSQRTMLCKFHGAEPQTLLASGSKRLTTKPLVSGKTLNPFTLQTTSKLRMLSISMSLWLPPWLGYSPRQWNISHFKLAHWGVVGIFSQAFRTSHPGPSQIYFSPFAFRTPKQPKRELLISHFAPIRSAPITLHPRRWARQNCIAALDLFPESKNCGLRNFMI
jgi:hypothetical protein